MKTFNKYLALFWVIVPTFISDAFADQYVDQVARGAGFRDWNPYQSTYNFCLQLMSVNNNNYLSGANCRYDDMNCMMREAQEMMSATHRLMNSQEWRSNNCHRIAWGSSKPSYNELVDQVEDLQNRIGELENR